MAHRRVVGVPRATLARAAKPQSCTKAGALSSPHGLHTNKTQHHVRILPGAVAAARHARAAALRAAGRAAPGVDACVCVCAGGSRSRRHHVCLSEVQNQCAAIERVLEWSTSAFAATSSRADVNKRCPRVPMRRCSQDICLHLFCGFVVTYGLRSYATAFFWGLAIVHRFWRVAGGSPSPDSGCRAGGATQAVSSTPAGNSSVK